MTEYQTSFRAQLWKYPTSKAAWFFVTLPEASAADIRFFFPHRKGFGSVPVRVSIGQSQWKTSVFPDKQSNSFILPVKSDIRTAEQIHEGDTLEITLTLKP